MELNIIKNYLTNNRCYQKGETCQKIGIQLHTIGTGQGTAQSVADYWDGPAVSACVHYCVDADTPGKVLQFLPEERRSWADKGYGNNNLITFEICESDYILYTNGANYDVLDTAKFKEDIMCGYNTAVLLCADICRRHGWNPTDKLPSGLYLISSHDEGRRAGLSSGHVDPTHVWNRFGLSMDDFRLAVKEVMEYGEEKYYVRKTWGNKKSQIGAYVSLENAKKACKPGYHVYDSAGKKVYTPPVFEKGKKYRMLTALSIRKEPDGKAPFLMYRDIPADKRNLFKKGKDGRAMIKKGIGSKCLGEYQKDSKNVYMKISRGWVLARYKGKDRVEKE